MVGPGAHTVFGTGVPEPAGVLEQALTWSRLPPPNAPPCAGSLLQYPHIGTVLPSVSVVVIRCAARLTVVTVCADAIPLASSREREPAVRADFSVIRSIKNLMLMLMLRSLRLVNLRGGRIDDHHHHHAAREHVVRRDLALVVRVPHERVTSTGILVGKSWRSRRRYELGTSARNRLQSQVRCSAVPQAVSHDGGIGRCDRNRLVVIGAPFTVIRRDAGRGRGIAVSCVEAVDVRVTRARITAAGIARSNGRPCIGVTV